MKIIVESDEGKKLFEFYIADSEKQEAEWIPMLNDVVFGIQQSGQYFTVDSATLANDAIRKTVLENMKEKKGMFRHGAFKTYGEAMKQVQEMNGGSR